MDVNDREHRSERDIAREAQKLAEQRGYAAESIGHEVYSVANIITIGRLLLVPFFFMVLISNRHNKDLIAFLLYATAAITDWIDGQIARRTGTVTTLGSVLDPIVDRTLIAAGVVGLYLVDRLPLWVVGVLVLRDVYLLSGSFVLERRGLRVPVTFIGKATTAALLAGFSLLIAGWPTVTIAGTSVLLGTYFMYLGLVLSMATAVGYTFLAVRALRVAAARR